MPFKPGESGNPAGRPFGSENKLGSRAKRLANRIMDRLEALPDSVVIDGDSYKDLVKEVLKLIPKESTVHMPDLRDNRVLKALEKIDAEFEAEEDN